MDSQFLWRSWRVNSDRSSVIFWEAPVSLSSVLSLSAILLVGRSGKRTLMGRGRVAPALGRPGGRRMASSRRATSTPWVLRKLVTVVTVSSFSASGIPWIRMFWRLSSSVNLAFWDSRAAIRDSWLSFLSLRSTRSAECSASYLGYTNCKIQGFLLMYRLQFPLTFNSMNLKLINAHSLYIWLNSYTDKSNEIGNTFKSEELY